MKPLKYLSPLLLIILLLSCTSIEIPNADEDNLTVYIDCTSNINSNAYEKISSDISLLGKAATKNADYKKEKSKLMSLKKNINNTNKKLSNKSNEDIYNYVANLMQKNGYTVINTKDARYTLTCKLYVEYEINHKTEMNYNISLDLFDGDNIPIDFFYSSKLDKYDNKLDEITHIDTKQYYIPLTWNMNGQAKGKDETDAYSKMMEDIKKNIDNSFVKQILSKIE